MEANLTECWDCWQIHW